MFTSLEAAEKAQVKFEAEFGHGGYRYEIRSYGELRWQVFVFSKRSGAFLTVI